MGILDRLINKLPFVAKINGYKTTIAGALLAIAVVMIQLSNLLPLEYAGPMIMVAEGLKQLAGVLGVVGVAGKIAKLPGQLDAQKK